MQGEIDLLSEEIDYWLVSLKQAHQKKIDQLIEEVDCDRVIEADSLLVQIYYIVELVSFVDRLNQEINRCLPLQQTHFECRSSRLTIECVIEAGSLIDLLIEEIDFELVIVAGSLVACERMTRFTGGQSDESEQIIALRIDVIEAGSLVARELIGESIHWQVER